MRILLLLDTLLRVAIPLLLDTLLRVAIPLLLDTLLRVPIPLLLDTLLRVPIPLLRDTLLRVPIPLLRGTLLQDATHNPLESTQEPTHKLLSHIPNQAAIRRALADSLKFLLLCRAA